MRGLDQNGPGEGGKNLESLWSQLVSGTDESFHAAEESTLRWLLKSMNGSTPAAEAMRRFPLTWTILDYVLARIPLFSLAKSLADRKFIAVLQQTLKDLSAPSTETAARSSSKRKRSPSLQLGSDELKSAHGCLSTAQAVFGSVKSLLHRLDNVAGAASRDRIGAEHIRSLFCTLAAETISLVAPSFAICQLLLDTQSFEVEGSEQWVKTISAVWDMHLQSNDDPSDVAVHLFTTPAVMLSSLEKLCADGNTSAPSTLSSQWSTDLLAFLQKNLVLPSRTAFLNRQDFAPITRALEVSQARIGDASVALYYVAARGSDLAAEGSKRKDTAEWMKRLFQAVEESLSKHPERNALMENVIRQAIKLSAPVDVKLLREIARRYSLDGTPVAWSLLASVASCDPGIFQSGGDGSDLLEIVCKKSHTASEQDAKQALPNVLGAVRQSFVMRRDLGGFLKLWFTQLCQTEDGGEVEQSSWFGSGPLDYSGQQLHAMIEKELTPPQLGEIIDWLESQPTQSHPKSTCVIIDVIYQGLRKENFIDAAGLRLFNLVWSSCAGSAGLPLKWRIVSKTMSSVSPEQRQSVWDTIKGELSQTLKKDALSKADTFEAFCCCYKAWDAVTPDEKLASELAAITQKFIGRLTKDTVTESTLASVELCKDITDPQFDTKTACAQYLSCFVTGGGRFNRLYVQQLGDVPPPVKMAIDKDALSPLSQDALWQNLLRNDVNLNEPKLERSLIDQLITLLEESTKEKHWPSAPATMAMRTLAAVPMDGFNRWQREKIMGILNQGSRQMEKRASKASLGSWNTLMSLVTKIMDRPTFYDELKFSRLVDTAKATSTSVTESSASDLAMLEITERLVQLASVTIRQMAENIDERSLKYFGELSEFIVSLQDKKGKKSSEDKLALSSSILKAFIVEAGRSSPLQSNTTLVKLVDEAKESLSTIVVNTVSAVIADPKLLDGSDTAIRLTLFAALDAASVIGDVSSRYCGKAAAVSKLAEASMKRMATGDVAAWKLQAFLRTSLPAVVELPVPMQFENLEKLPTRLRGPLLKGLVLSVTQHARLPEKVAYLRDLIAQLSNGCYTDGQSLAVQELVNQIIGMPTSFICHTLSPLLM